MELVILTSVFVVYVCIYLFSSFRFSTMCCQPVAKVKAVGICSLMGFYHARHALFPDEYIKIITVQTEFLITDLLAIVLCFLYAPLLLHALFIYLHQ